MPEPKSRRRKGSGGTVETRKGSGVWRVRVYVGTDRVTKNPRQVERTVRGNQRRRRRSSTS